MRNESIRTRKKGFTLVELLVVVAIIALLVSILLPSLTKARELARRVACASNLSAMGKGWAMYWSTNDNKIPGMINPRSQIPPVADNNSSFNYLIWCRSGAGGPDYVGAGILYKTKLLSSERAYFCPTIEQTKNPWFSKTGGGWSSGTVGSNPWPVDPGSHTRMSYGTRRMDNYDTKSIGRTTIAYTDADAKYLLMKTGMGGIKNASSFAYMSDCAVDYTFAELSHVPGINVQFLDGHVSFYQDNVGDVLYRTNGVNPASNGTDTNNWLQDDIWMIIGGYHTKPVGQGQ